jgi:hypothetical protein
LDAKRGRQLSLAEILKYPTAAISRYPGTFVVIGALDEMPESHHTTILTSLITLHETNWMITSRPRTVIQDFLEDTGSQRLKVAAIDADVRAYLEHRFLSRPTLEKAAGISTNIAEAKI